MHSVLVISSPMARAIRTIEPAVQRLGLPQDRWLCYGQYYEARLLVVDFVCVPLSLPPPLPFVH